MRHLAGQGGNEGMKAAVVRTQDTDSTKFSTGNLEVADDPVVIYTPPLRKPMAQITGFDIPRGVDRNELVLEFETSDD